MNKVGIKLNELGPVKQQKIELKPVMLFTGESSLGKSYVNFLSYYLFHVFTSDRMNEFLLEKIGVDVNEVNDHTFDLRTSDIIEWMQNDVRKFFVYLYNFEGFKCDVEFDFENVEDNYHISYHKQNFHHKEVNVLSIHIESNGEKNRMFFSPQNADKALCSAIRRNLCSNFLGQSFRYSCLLPPGRASLLSGDFTSQRGSSKLGLYDLFLRDNDWINSMVLWNKQVSRKDTSFFTNQIHKLIKGDIVSEKDGLFLLTEDQQKLPLGAAASSIKELTPLLQFILSDDISNTSICIEEPEAHLHPEMQLAVADLLAACINMNVAMQITTHSDYFLQRVNQLLKYGCIREKSSVRYQQLCEETGHQPEHYLNRKDVNAYYFSSEGGKTIVNPLEIGDNGIPLSSFFNAVALLSKEDELLDNELERILVE